MQWHVHLASFALTFSILNIKLNCFVEILKWMDWFWYLILLFSSAAFYLSFRFVHSFHPLYMYQEIYHQFHELFAVVLKPWQTKTLTVELWLSKRDNRFSISNQVERKTNRGKPRNRERKRMEKLTMSNK